MMTILASKVPARLVRSVMAATVRCGAEAAGGTMVLERLGGRVRRG